MSEPSPEITALARKLAQEMAPKMAEQMAQRATRENFMRILYTQKNTLSTLKDQVTGISADLDDHAYQLEAFQGLLVAVAMQLNAIASKLGIPSEIQLPSDDPSPEE